MKSNMLRRWSRLVPALVVALAAVLSAPAPAGARVCSYDAVPAATLLFPFVVIDYTDPMYGPHTVLSITNTSPRSQIVHVTFWSDTHEAVLDFNLVLAGYDSELVDVSDVLYNGILPITGTDGDLVVSGGIAERGPVDGSPDLAAPDPSSSVINRCPESSASYPGNYATPIPPATLAQIETALTRSQYENRVHGDCEGGTYIPNPPTTFISRTTSDLTWLYVTADVVWTCTGLTAKTNAATYWLDGPTNNPAFDPNGAQRMTDNVLTGHVEWRDDINRMGETSLAVHVEADKALGDFAPLSPVINQGSGQFQSFYHQYSSSVGLSDLREPLPTAWATTYQSAPPNTSGAIRVWKAPNASPDLDDTPGFPPMVALDCMAYSYYSWDEDENVTLATAGSDNNRLPLATQEVPVNEFNIADYYGWLLFVWPRSNSDQFDNFQVWMGVYAEAFGSYSLGRPAAVIANDNCMGSTTPPKSASPTRFTLGSTADSRRSK